MITGAKNMAAGNTVAAGLAEALIAVAEARGADRIALAARAGLARDDLRDHDNRIPLAIYVALMRAAKAMCNDPALGLHFGEESDLAKVSVVGLLAEASTTVAEAMAQLNRYGRLVIEFDGGPDRFRAAMEQGGMWFVDQRANPNDFHELSESTFARTVVRSRAFLKEPLLRQVHFTHPDPGYADEYARVFQCPVTFGTAWNAMEYDPRLLAVPIQLQPRFVFGIFSQHADALLKELESSRSTRGRVESLLMPILHKGDVSMDAVAGEMALSRQTLFRKLKAEGTTFEKVLDDLRRTLALSYLGGRKVSVNEVAYLVGFSDATAFSRAFKRWTGKSPRTFAQSGSSPA
jgi:AraC-like DNA-binding protein